MVAVLNPRPNGTRWGGMGWRPDLPDARDLSYRMIGEARALPASVDLRPNCPTPYDQGQLGSCTANAGCAALEYNQKVQGMKPYAPSRLATYFNERVLEGTISWDSGAQVRDAAKVLAKLGAPSETVWPYIESKFATKPPPNVYEAGLLDRAVSYQRITPTLDNLRRVLANKHVFIFGFSAYESFESENVAETGQVPMPEQSEAMIGGHSMMVVGYSMAKSAFLVQNSWGTSWGMNGYCWMPFEYLIDPTLASDFWNLRTVSASLAAPAIEEQSA